MWSTSLSVTETHLSLLAALRFKHTVLLLPLHLPSSLTLVQPVIFPLSVLISNHSSPPLLDLSMDLEMAAGLLKVMGQPNYLPNCLPVVVPISSYSVHVLYLTPQPHSFPSLALMVQTAICSVEMVAVSRLRTIPWSINQENVILTGTKGPDQLYHLNTPCWFTESSYSIT